MPGASHPWILVAAIYVLGFLAGIYYCAGKARGPRVALLLYLSILGLGLFTYFVGRSHDHVLVLASWPAILIAFLVADQVWEWGRARHLSRGIALAAALPAQTWGTLCALLIASDALGLWRLAVSNLGARDRSTVAENVAFIRERATGNEAVILTRFQGVYLAESGRRSPLPGPGTVETLTHEQGGLTVSRLIALSPDRIFVGPPFSVPGSRNPFAPLLPLLRNDYRLMARTRDNQVLVYQRHAR